MTAAYTNNDIIVTESTNVIISKTTGVTESGKWNFFIYRRYWQEKLVNLLTPSIAITISMKTNRKNYAIYVVKPMFKKIAQHKANIKCRLTHFIRQAELQAKEDPITQ